jgi:iron complex transport system substrate-binding protein
VVIASVIVLAGSCGTASDPAASTEAEVAIASTPVPTTSDDPSASSDAAPSSNTASASEVTVTDMSGELTVPVTTEGIYALDEYVAIALLTLGITPANVNDFFNDQAALGILSSLAIEASPGDVSDEAMLATNPAMFVGIGHPAQDERRAVLAARAPVVLPDFTAPWEDQLRVFAAITGTEAKAEQLIADVAGRTDALRTGLDAAGMSGALVSMLYAFPDGTFFALGNTALGGRIVAELGFTRPPIQDAEGDFGFIPISAEILGNQTGDVIIALGGANTGNQTVFDSDLFDPGSATTATVDGGPWSQNTVLSALWILHDLEAILLGDGDVLTAEDSTPLWAGLMGNSSAEPGSDAADDATPLDEVGALQAAADETLVALDENAALNLLSLGIEPDLVLTSLESATFAVLADELGLETAEFVVAEPSFEYLATLEADRFVALANPFIVERAAEYEAIAPLVTAPLVATWQDQVGSFADAFALPETGASLIASVEGDIAATATEIAAADGGGQTVSLLSARVGTILAAAPESPSASVLAAVGLAQPAAQGGADSGGLPFIPLSGEQLADHDADHLLLGAGEVFDLTPLTSSPLYAALDAVGRGDVDEVVGEIWLVGGSAFAAWWMAEDLRSIVAGEPAGTATDVVARWSSFGS